LLLTAVTTLGLMVRSAAQQRVSNHGATSSFETHRSAMLLRMMRIKIPAGVYHRAALRADPLAGTTRENV
jgi:hypothetical protein